MTDRELEAPRSTARKVLDRPSYSLGEAAQYLRMNRETLKSWALGRTYPVAEGSRDWPPLFEIADRAGKRLSFRNLVEANALTAFRRVHGVKVRQIRNAIDFVREKLGVERPLCDEKFRTDGVHLFVERYEQLINASQGGQSTIREATEAALERVEFEPDSGVPVRLYASGPDPRERSQFVAFDPTIAFGRPALVETGVPIENIADRFRAGESIGSLVEDFGVGQAEIEEALRQANLLRIAA